MSLSNIMSNILFLSVAFTVYRQRFYSTLNNDEDIITSQKAPFAKVDLGIVKYNLEAVTGRKCK